MHRIDTPTAQKDKFGAGKNGFTRGNPQTGTPATDLDDDYFDSIQEELAAIIEASGAALDKSKRNQVLTAMKALLLSREHPFADIKADGAAAVAEALSNLGLGAAAKKDIGTGAGQVPDMSSFVFNLGGSGAAYNWLPGGNLIQMGRATTSTTGQQLVSIPITYPNGNFNVVAIAMDQAVPNIISAAGTTASQIAINAWGANSSGNLGQRVSTPIFWMTFGN